MYFGYKSLIRYMSYKYALPPFGLSLHFLDDVLQSTKVKIFIKSSLFFLLLLLFWLSYLRTLYQIHEDLSLFYSFGFYALVFDSF